MKIELIADWKRCSKFWSVRFSAIGACVMGLVAIWPESLLYLWSMMPYEVRAMIPDRIASVIAAIIFAMSALSRIVKQKVLENGKRDEDA